MDIIYTFDIYILYNIKVKKVSYIRYLYIKMK